MTGPNQPQSEGAEIISQNCRGKHSTGHIIRCYIHDPNFITLDSVYCTVLGTLPDLPFLVSISSSNKREEVLL